MADGTTDAADAGGAAMPQLDFSTWPNQIFWLVVALVLIYFILSRVALPRIGAILAERSGTITNDIAAAEDLKDKARAAETAYDKALADARAEAHRIVAEAKAEIQAELAVELRRADAEIGARTVESEKALADLRDQAIVSIAEVARDTAAEIVTALGGTADQGRIDAALAARAKG